MIYVTDLTEYLFCPYKLYLKKIKGLPLPQTSEMLTGTIIHKIYEEVLLRERIIIEQRIDENMGIDEIFKILYADSKRVIKNIMIQNKSRLKEAGVDYLELIKELQEELKEDELLKSIRIKKYISIYGKDSNLYKNLFMLKDMEYPISSNELGLSGKIDKLEEDSEGNIFPVELKTGLFSNGIRKHEKIQVSAYALLLEKERGIKIPLGFLEYYQVKQRIPFLIKEEDKKEVLEILEKVKELLNNENEPKKEKKNFCNRCGYNEFCWGE
ncbi:MAG: PD-(D/E)XK nuclease superfamily protein [Candidatus Methanofastidiosum methylothiophilum]|uniref:CRISPR-associated exonuclease Cas4 n=1 Tax=Candidatus Methanofastidiosum methylothiophilum TaxID=1705564 RepID=A0A150IQZ6_9EURY|nr:MAG: PD-(D/E)XK nuclease superfamily protein [Candidatus Methanofastidiosum methylthiophilus]KYC47403.1 MAG: PD-(D/E)XK nuclease superfamily protein [Candidatus Methanofastidiosum methylthiophilus]